MLIYYILFIFVIGFGLLQFFKFKNSKKSQIIYLASSGIFLTFISGFRYGIGFDFHAYFMYFELTYKVSWANLKNNPLDFGFSVYLKLISLITTNPQIMYIITSAIMVSIAMFVIYKYSKIPFISVMFYICTNAFTSGMNLFRFTFAGMISFLGVYFLKKSTLRFTKKSFTLKAFLDDLWRNFLPFAIIVILASSMHRVALILLPAYYLSKIDLTKVVAGIYGGLAIIYVLVADPLMNFLSNAFFEGGYVVEGHEYFNPGGTQFIIIHILFVLLIFLTKKRIIKKDPSNLVLINMLFFASSIYLMAGLKTFILSRLTYFFYIYVILLIPEMLESILPYKKEAVEINRIEVKSSENKKLSNIEREVLTKYADSKIFYRLMIVASVFLFAFMQNTAIFGARHGAHGVYPYRSSIDAVNRLNSLNFNNDRNKELNKLIPPIERHSEDPNISTYLFELDDPDYISFIVFSGNGTDYMTTPTENGAFFHDWPINLYNNLGLDADFEGKKDYSYIAISDGGKKVIEKISEEKISEKLTVDGLDVQIASSGFTTGNANASIKIDGVEHVFYKGLLKLDGDDSIYETSAPTGTKIVVYDKVLKKVVDSVSFNPSTFREMPARRPDDLVKLIDGKTLEE